MDVESEFSCCKIDYTNNTVMSDRWLNSDYNSIYTPKFGEKEIMFLKIRRIFRETTVGSNWIHNNYRYTKGTSAIHTGIHICACRVEKDWRGFTHVALRLEGKQMSWLIICWRCLPNYQREKNKDRWLVEIINWKDLMTIDMSSLTYQKGLTIRWAFY